MLFRFATVMRKPRKINFFGVRDKSENFSLGQGNSKLLQCFKSKNFIFRLAQAAVVEFILNVFTKTAKNV